jgi:hypothetical protein|tara:strand:+ start:473 stop:595 length:123 start_codon:yes stop_codon:yes gene_type:complete
VLASWLIWAGLDNEFKARIPIMGWDHAHLLVEAEEAPVAE